MEGLEGVVGGIVGGLEGVFGLLVVSLGGVVGGFEVGFGLSVVPVENPEVSMQFLFTLSRLHFPWSLFLMHFRSLQLSEHPGPSPLSLIHI